MIDIRSGSTEELILHFLLKRYPVTDRDLRRELGLSKLAVERVLHSLAASGIVILEPLPDVTFVRLVRRDLHFVGLNPSQKKKLKHKKTSAKKKKLLRRRNDYDGMMYG